VGGSGDSLLLEYCERVSPGPGDCIDGEDIKVIVLGDEPVEKDIGLLPVVVVFKRAERGSEFTKCLLLVDGASKLGDQRLVPAFVERTCDGTYGVVGDGLELVECRGPWGALDSWQEVTLTEASGLRRKNFILGERSRDVPGEISELRHA
jgi:hypothetical protein